MTWLLNEEATETRVDAEGSYSYFSDTLRFRPAGYDDSTIYKNETSMRMTSTYANGLVMTAEEFEKRGDTVRAEEMVRRALYISPGYRGALQALANFLSDQGRLEELRALVDTTGGNNRSWMNTSLARLELREGDQLAGARLLEATLTGDPKFRPAFRELMRYYYGVKDAARMHELLQRWLRFNPGDQEAANMLKEIEGALISKGNDTNSP
jgi:Tfp pilus assembly protein PilF